MKYTMRDTGLYNGHNRRIAFTRGDEIYDGNNRRVAIMHGNYLFDSENRKMMTVRGGFIFDADDKQVASLVDAQKSIKGAREKMQAVALWYCFIR
jgi:formylmethanofuran:tetrahydromethanopterin formyltransferase